jgi:hypothetical protein
MTSSKIDQSKLDKLDKLVDHLACKETISIDILGSCDANGVLIQEMPKTIHLKPDVSHSVALHSFEATSYFPNLTSANNKFYYTTPDSTEEQVIEFLPGAYDISDYNLVIKRILKARKQDPRSILIELTQATARTLIILDKGCKVYFNKPNTWRECLGFGAEDLEADGVYISDKRSRIQTIQKIYMSCNICTGSISSNKIINKGNILFSFSNTKTFGYPLMLAPNNLAQRQLVTKTINTIRFEFFDNEGTPVNFMGEPISGELVISQV